MGNNRYFNHNDLNKDNFDSNYNRNNEKNKFRRSAVLQNSNSMQNIFNKNYNLNNFFQQNQIRKDNNDFYPNDNIGINLNISYKNSYEDDINQIKNGKKVYGKLLLEQVKLNNINKKIELQRKRRQEVLDELKLQKQIKEIELQNEIEKNKKYQKIINRFKYDNDLLEKHLKKSENELDNYELNLKNKPLIKSNSTYFEQSLSLNDKLNYEKRKAKLFESHLFNKEILKDLEKLKLRNTISLGIIKKELSQAKYENYLSEHYKNILMCDLDEIKKEMKLKDIQSKLVTNFIKDEFLNKVKEKKFRKEQERFKNLPIIDYNTNLFHENENINRTYLDKLEKYNDEEDDINKRVDLYKILQKNEIRLKGLSFLEERIIK